MPRKTAGQGRRRGCGRVWTRRGFLRGAEAALIAAAAAGASVPGGRARAEESAPPRGRKPDAGRLKLGLVTYNLAKGWDIETIIRNCTEAKFIEDYPFRRLLGALRESGYGGYSCAEIPESGDPVRLMKYYRALFLAYQDLL